jgi:hypothetical protein
MRIFLKKKLKEYSVADSLFPRFRRPAAAGRQIKVSTPKKFYSFACPVAI